MRLEDGLDALDLLVKQFLKNTLELILGIEGIDNQDKNRMAVTAGISVYMNMAAHCVAKNEQTLDEVMSINSRFIKEEILKTWQIKQNTEH